MYRLAIEMSTAAGSLALARDGKLHGERNWQQQERPHQILFGMLPDFLRVAGLDAADIGHYVIGVGPGSFSGIRVALAAANGLALPSKVRVNGLSSAATLAWAALRAKSEPAEIAIIGDARRNRCWVAHYRRSSDGLETLAEPALHPLEALDAVLPKRIRVLSPDWGRLQTVLDALALDVDLVRDVCTPTATAMVELAEQYARRQLPLHPPQPIYLHPPV